MKASRKLLLAVAVVILTVFLVAMLMLRNGVLSLQQNAQSKHRYEAVPVNEFDKLDFSSHWIVEIRQGKSCKVESTADENSFLKPTIENIDGTLYFKVDTVAAEENRDSIFVKISLPMLSVIKAVKGTGIHMENFQADSLLIILEDGCVFTGINNTIKYITCKTSGENLLNITKIY